MSPIRKFRRSQSGSTAVEFALIMPVFLVLVLGAIELGLQVATQMLLDNGTAYAARQIEIGKMTDINTFRTDVCQTAGFLIPSCTSDLDVYVTSGGAFTSLTPASLKQDGTFSQSPFSIGTGACDSGSNSPYVLVQVAYTHDAMLNMLTQLVGLPKVNIESTFVVLNEPFGCSGTT